MLKSANLLHKCGLDDSQLHTTVTLGIIVIISFYFIIVADLVVAAEAVAAAVEVRCATSQGVMETVEDPGVTAVILIPHPLLHLICVNEWTAM